MGVARTHTHLYPTSTLRCTLLLYMTIHTFCKPHGVMCVTQRTNILYIYLLLLYEIRLYIIFVRMHKTTSNVIQITIDRHWFTIVIYVIYETYCVVNKKMIR